MTTITMSDFFCGAGGSSAGAEQIPGVKVQFAANHWDKAIQTHSLNHADAEHLCADISQYEPSLVPHTDIAWFSPSCTNHSNAKGIARADREKAYYLGKAPLPEEAAERSRATMWDVVRFSEYHRYEAVIVENVVEVTAWEPFPAWLEAMHHLGYRSKILMLNSAFMTSTGLPAPQTRDRFFAVFWKDGNLDLSSVENPGGGAFGKNGSTLPTR